MVKKLLKNLCLNVGMGGGIVWGDLSFSSHIFKILYWIFWNLKTLYLHLGHNFMLIFLFENGFELKFELTI
jgi:hypothetical protein